MPRLHVLLRIYVTRYFRDQSLRPFGCFVATRNKIRGRYDTHFGIVIFDEALPKDSIPMHMLFILEIRSKERRYFCLPLKIVLIYNKDC